MPKEHKARRREIKARLDRAEKTLCATRSSAGAQSRAIRLHLEREIHASRRDLALLDVQMTIEFSSKADTVSREEDAKT